MTKRIKRNNYTTYLEEYLFGGWALIVALAAGYCFLVKLLSPLVYLAGVTPLLLAVSVLLYRWLCTKGAERFEKLT